jgi:hypothetical protein
MDVMIQTGDADPHRHIQPASGRILKQWSAFAWVRKHTLTCPKKTLPVNLDAIIIRDAVRPLLLQSRE